MKAHTEYLWFETPERRALVNITEKLGGIVAASGVREGMCLVSAMHITSGIWVNDEESGLKQDLLDWLEKLAPVADYRLRISDQTRHRLGALPATLSEHTPPASRTITRHFFGGNPATAG